MSIEQKLCEVKIFQLQSELNAMRCIGQRFAFKNSRISYLALIFNLKNPHMTVLNAKKSVAGGETETVKQLETLLVIYRFVLAIDTNLWLSG